MTDLHLHLDNLTFPEAPRWHDGRLVLSDFYAHEVLSVDMAGTRRSLATVPGQPSGLGWHPDGRMMVVSMTDQKLLIDGPDGLSEQADLSAHARFWCNDMVVDDQGGAYIGNFGFDHRAGEPVTPTNLVRVDPDGTCRIAADNLLFPNGIILTPDGGTLIVAETYGGKLTAFDRGHDGNLSNRRVFADLDGGYPDGICLDAEGAVWVADPRAKQTYRVLSNGQIDRRIETNGRGSYACMLGGDDGRTLFICTNTGSGPEAAKARAGRLESITVEIPRAGRP